MIAENEETILYEIVEWLSSKLGNASKIIKQSNTKFHFDPYTRTFMSETRKIIYLTAKGFDLLCFFMFKGQVFTKDQLCENIWR